MPDGIAINFGLEELILFIFFLGFCIILLVVILRQKKALEGMEKKLRKLSRGKSGGSLESEIMGLFEVNDSLKENAVNVQRNVDKQRAMTDSCLRKVGLVKYDAFNQMGGKLSFALAILNGMENGIIINSVHSQDGNYIYVREVRDGKGEGELGAEETKALSKALAQM